MSNVTTLATRHCDGSFLTGEPLVRVDGATVTGRIDWNLDGDTTDTGLVQDINFNSHINDGTVDQLALLGSNDFQRMDLRHVGSRRNAGSERIEGGLSLDVGFGDVGFGDVGFGDVGFGDVGFGDVGFGDVGFGDVGFGDVGFGDVGFGDVGAGQGDLDFEAASGLSAPVSLTATTTTKAIRLNWAPPHVGSVTGYVLYRVVGGAVTPTSVISRVATLPETVLTFDDVQVTLGATYTYFVVAELAPSGPGSVGSVTGPSNFATVLALPPR